MKRKKLLVEDLMSTALITMKEDATVASAQLEMHLASIRHIPVVDGRHHVVGIISSRDLLRAQSEGKRAELKVGQVMTRTVRTVRTDIPADVAADVMLEGKFGSLPVVGDEGQRSGIVTESDFLAVARDALRGVDLSRKGE